MIKTSKVRLRTRVSLFVLAGLSIASLASAVGTRSFDLNSQEDFLGGDLRGVAVDSQGHLRAGWNLGTASLTNASSVWAALEMPDGSVLLGTGNHGKVMKVAGGQITEFADTKQTAVTSLALAPGGVVYAATINAGKVFKIEGAGKVTELPAIVDAEHIWGIAYDTKKNGLYVATGPNGKLFFLPATGAAQLVFDSDEPNLRCVAIGDDGSVYVGTTGKALVYKVASGGRATVLIKAPGDEVLAIEKGKNGVLWVVANEMGEAPEPPRRSPAAPFNPPSPANPPRVKVGKGALLRIDSEGKSEEMLSRKDTHFTSLGVDEAGHAFVGTGAEGRVYTVDDNHTSTLMADTDERQIGAILVSGKTKLIAASDPAVVHEIHGIGGADAVWTSKVLDAGIRAKLGRLFWRADGKVEMAVRTGNSDKPDSSWSDWSKSLDAPGDIDSPLGRYVQIRARFGKEPGAVVREVELPYVTDNERAVITSIESKGKSGSNTASTIPVAATEVPAHDAKMKLTWKVDNPDGDQLRYRVQFRFDPQTLWRDLTKPDETLTKPEIEWDTSTLPEGIYRVRIEASDELANPPDRVLRHSFESGPILVDNTPPVFRSISASGRRIRAEVVDGLGPIARVDFALDGHTDWRPLLPKDGVFDEPSEEIDTDLSSVLLPGPHLVALRVFDRAGNVAVRDVEMKLASRFARDRGSIARAQFSAS